MLNQSFLGSSLYKKEDAQGKMLISSNFVVYISKKKYKRTLQSLVSYIIKNFLPDIDISLIFFAKNFRNFFCFLASRMIYLLKSYPPTMSNVLKPSVTELFRSNTRRPDYGGQNTIFSCRSNVSQLII